MGAFYTLAMRASVLLLVLSSTALADPPAVGTVAPDFTLPSTSGKPIQLSKMLRKAGPVVLAFYPKAFTGG
jgi:hypothetical protein